MSEVQPGSDWITLRAALTAITRRFAGETEAKLALAERFRDGELRIWAQRATSTLRWEDPAAASLKGSNLHNKYKNYIFGRSGEVDKEVLPGPSSYWDLEISNWRWGSGELKFHFKNHSELQNRITLLKGVHLLSEEISKIADMTVPVAQLGKKVPDQTPAAGRLRAWDWEPVLTELIAIAHYDGLEDGIFRMPLTAGGKRGEQKRLEDWLANKMQLTNLGGEPPSSSEVRKRAKAIMIALRTRHVSPDKKT